MPLDHAVRFRRSYRIVDGLSRPLVRFEGLDLPPATGAALAGSCVVAANHRSLFDALAAIRVLGSLGVNGRVVSAAWLWQNRPLGRLLDVIGAIPLHPGRGGLETIHEAVAALGAGDCLVMTPEGRVVPPEDRTDGVGTGHKIISRIACRAGVPVIPAALVGTDELWPLDRRFPRVRPGRRPLIRYGFGAPIRFASASHRDNVDETLARISRLLARLEREPIGASSG